MSFVLALLTGGSPGSAYHHVQHNDAGRPLPYGPMKMVGQRIETPTAIIERSGDRLIEQHFKAEARFGPGVIDRNRKARWKLAEGEPHLVLIVLPHELPVHPPAMNEDHFRQDSEARLIIALAIVAPSMQQNTAAKFYFRYYAQAFEARVFEEEAEARAWLSAVLERRTAR